MNTFTQEVATHIFDYTRKHPRNHGSLPAESVWGFGFTKDSPRKIFSLSKIFLACPNVSYGFKMEPGDCPLQFHISFFQLKTGKTLALGEHVDHIAHIDDLPKVIDNAVSQAKNLADAVRFECLHR